MSVQILVDMNLSPDWVPLLQRHGWVTVHWSTVGDPRAADQEIMGWAVANYYVVFTHDLDFGTLLALTHAGGPSVIQVRGQDILPDHMGSLVVAGFGDTRPTWPRVLSWSSMRDDLGSASCRSSRCGVLAG